MHIMELADGTLTDMVLDQPFEVVDITTRVRLFTQILEGVASMEKQGFVYRGLFPNSILLKQDESGELHAKIAGLGFVASPSSDPEAGSWGQKGDAFAAGLILYQMLFEGRKPSYFCKGGYGYWSSLVGASGLFDLSQDEKFAAAKAAAAGSASQGGDRWFDEVLSVMEGLLDSNEAGRMSAQAAHAALAKLDWNEERARKVLVDTVIAAIPRLTEV